MSALPVSESDVMTLLNTIYLNGGRNADTALSMRHLCSLIKNNDLRPVGVLISRGLLIGNNGYYMLSEAALRKINKSKDDMS